MSKASKGLVIDQGLSPFNGEPYVAIMVLKSSNRKTGQMAQVYIIRPDIHPVDALEGADAAVCGNCPHKREWDPELLKFTRSCYVNVGQGVAAVYKAFKRGVYADAMGENLQPWLSKLAKVRGGFKIRWGAYGDPAMIAPEVVQQLNRVAVAHTGYTHQWRYEWASAFKGVFMASCDSFADYMDASSVGWKTFAVVAKGATPYSGKLCPATAPNSVAQCNTCKLCDGAKTDIFVEAHGVGAAYVKA